MYLIAIAGATASGKTKLAIDLAKHFGADIISCDARQFYREMSIGTAKPTSEELAAAPHHFVNNLSITDTYTVGDYEKEALAFLSEYYQSHKVAILVGGSGLFYRALCEGSLDPFPDIAPEIRQKWETTLQTEGIKALQDALKIADPVYFEQVDKQNHRRLIRALEVSEQTGRAFSSFRTATNAPRPFKVIKIGLAFERGNLYERINNRVDNMFKEGLLEEATALYDKRDLQPLQTVGYREIFEFLDGRHPDLATTAELIRQNTRHYAKRQETWFKKESDLTWFDAQKDMDKILPFLESRIL
jgi:tRNA dimethylallyltransferase